MAITVVTLGKFVCSFSYGKVKDIFGGIRIKFHLGRAKLRVKRECGGEAQKERVFFAKFPLLSKI